MKPGSFKSMVESLAKHIANVLKKRGSEAVSSMKKQKKPMHEAPEEVPNGTRRDQLTFDFEYHLYMKKQSTIVSKILMLQL